MFRPGFAPPQIKFTISYEPMHLKGREDPKPFILCCHADQFHDLQTGSAGFEKMHDETYRLILPSNAEETEIKAFEKTIQDGLKCAANILEHLTRYHAGDSLRLRR